MRVPMLAIALGLADALVPPARIALGRPLPLSRSAPILANTYEPPQYQPLVADYVSDEPRQETRGGLTIAMGGLIATLMASASALSTTGTIATIAASAAGLFSFKVAKELNRRGVDRGSVSKFGTGIVWRLAALVVYTLASIVSFFAFVLSTLGRGVLRIADAASSFCNALSSTVPERRALPVPASQLMGRAADALELAPAVVAEEVAAPPAPAPARRSRATLDPASDASIGRELAIQQMLQRSASAAANARRIESERSQILAQKQSEAVAKALAESRKARSQPLSARPGAASPPSSLPSRPSYAAKSSAFAPSPPSPRREQSARASSFYNYQPGKPPAGPANSSGGATRPTAPPASSAASGVSTGFGVPTAHKSPSLASMARASPTAARPGPAPSKLDVSLAARAAKPSGPGAGGAGSPNPWLPRSIATPTANAPARAVEQTTPAPTTPPSSSATPSPPSPPASAPPPSSPSSPAAASPYAAPASGAPNPWLPRGYSKPSDVDYD